MGGASRVNATLELAAGYAWRLIVLVAATVLAGLVLAELRLVMLPVVVALVLSTFLMPPVRWLRRRGWRASLAAFAVLSIALAALGGLYAVLVPRVAGELRDLDFSLQRGIETVAAWVVEGPLGVSEADLERAIDRGLEQLRDNADTLLSGALTGAAAFVELVVGFLLTLVLLFFLLRDGETIGRWLVGLVAERHREAVREAGIRAWEVLSALHPGHDDHRALRCHPDRYRPVGRRDTARAPACGTHLLRGLRAGGRRGRGRPSPPHWSLLSPTGFSRRCW